MKNNDFLIDGLDSVLKFCHQYKKIICYGASDLGCITKRFLEINGVNVAFFLVSDSFDILEMRDGIPIYSVKTINKIPNDFGIILSLRERNHPDVMVALRRYL